MGRIDAPELFLLIVLPLMIVGLGVLGFTKYRDTQRPFWLVLGIASILAFLIALTMVAMIFRGMNS